MLAERKRAMLSEHELLQWETIAIHYLSYVKISQEMLKILDLRKTSGPSKEVDEILEYLAKHIKDGHLEDFGIELSWNNKQAITICNKNE